MSDRHSRAGASVQARVLDVLRRWGRAARRSGVIPNAYVFGSILHREGQLFDVSRDSDVDLLVIFDQPAHDAHERVQTGIRLKPLINKLNRKLREVLSVAEERPIVSLGVFWEFERQHVITGSQDPGFLVRNQFIDVCAEHGGLGALAMHPPPQLPISFSDAVFAVQQAQNIRKWSLRPDTRTNVQESAREDLPKPLLRAAARLRAFIEGENGLAYDLFEGLYLLQTLCRRDRANGSVLHREVADWMASHAIGRGHHGPLGPIHQLLLWEMLAIEAEKRMMSTSMPAQGPAEPSSEMDVARRSSDEARTRIGWSYVRSRPELTATARDYYKSVNEIGPSGLVGRAGWLPSSLVPLEKVRLSWNPGVSDVDTSASGRTDEESLFDFRRRTAPAVKLSDDLCYRLIGIDSDGEHSRLEFSPSHYSSYINTCEALGMELSSWRSLNPQQVPPAAAQLTLRGAPDQIYELGRRAAVPGVNTLLVVAGAKQAQFYLHERSGKVAEAEGALHVVPAGTFQPDSYDGAFQSRDFSLSRTVWRELAEELLGMNELGVARREGQNFLDDPRLKLLMSGLREGHAQLFYLGFGFDPLTTKPEILTCLLLRDELAKRWSFTDNYEGRYFVADFTPDVVSRYSRDRRMLPAGEACLYQALQLREPLMASLRW